MVRKTRGAPKRRDPLSYEAIADAYRQELRARSGGGPFSDYDLVRLGRFFGGRRLAAITDEAVCAYALRREERDHATLETINGELSTLHAIRWFAVRRGLIKKEELCRIEWRRIPVPAAASDSRRLRRHRWFKPAGPGGGAHPVDTLPVMPGRRRADAEDVAAIRAQYPHADTESRKWWARCMKNFRKHPGSLGNIERQLKGLGIPPSRSNSIK